MSSPNSKKQKKAQSPFAPALANIKREHREHDAQLAQLEETDTSSNNSSGTRHANRGQSRPPVVEDASRTDPSSRSAGLRNYKDPHAAQPFRRYYLGPMPFSSSIAKQVAAAILDDVETTDPVGICVAGKEGITLVQTAPRRGQHRRPSQPSGSHTGHGRATSLPPLSRAVSMDRSSTRTTSPTRWYHSKFLGSRPRASTVHHFNPRRGEQQQPSTATTTDTFLTARDGLTSPVDSPVKQRGESSQGAEQSISRDGLLSRSRMQRLRSDTHPMSSTPLDTTINEDEDDDDLLAPPIQQRKPRQRSVTLREVPSIQSLGGSVDGDRSGEEPSIDHPLASNRLSVQERRSLLSSRQGSADHRRSLRNVKSDLKMIPDEQNDLNAGDDTAHLTVDTQRAEQQRQASTSGIMRFSTTNLGTGVGARFTPSDIDFSHARSASRQGTGAFPASAAARGPRQSHRRDFSRQSRMSVASFGTRLTDGSFGATGGVRARLARALRPGLQQTETPSSRPHRAGLQRKGSNVTPQGHESRHHHHHLHRHHHRRLWTGGVAPGEVGTSAGGTKWVGQSFEVGARFWEVLEKRDEAKRKASLPKPVQVPEDDKKGEEDEDKAPLVESPGLMRSTDRTLRDSRHQDSGDTRPSTGKRSPSDVLSAFAQGAKQSRDEKSLKTTQGQEEEAADTAASIRPQITKVPFESKKPAGPEQNPVKPTSEQQTKAAVDPNGDDARPSTDPSVKRDGDNIEARHGWSGLASKMSAGSLSTSKTPAEISQKPRSESTAQEIKELNSRVQGVDVDSETGDLRLAPKRAPASTRSSLRSEAFYTPAVTVSRLTPNGHFDLSEPSDYFEMKTPQKPETTPRKQENKDESTPALPPCPPPMTALEAHSHPEPPIAADDKFPEVAMTLLRRPSDLDGVTDGPLISDTASDHAVSARPTNALNASPKSLVNTQLLSPDPMSPGGRSMDGFTTADTAGHARSTMDSHTPLLKGKVSSGSMIIHQDRKQEFGPALSTHRATPDKRKKTVQFDRGAGDVTAAETIRTFLRPPPVGRSFSALSDRQPSPSGDTAPAPPEEVLSRGGGSTLFPPTPSSALAPTIEEPEEFLTRRSILRRDRMLVRNDWTPSETVPQDLDESTSRSLIIREGEWKEYMVVLRMGRLELWDDTTKTNKFLGHSQRLHLAFVVPLARGATSISMYSHVDRIFALSYSQSRSNHKRMLNLKRSGTHILLFDARALSVGADWLWDLWREVGGTVPRLLEVHIPFFDFKIRFPIPDEVPDNFDFEDDNDPNYKLTRAERERLIGGEGYMILNRHRIISTVLKLAKKVPEWEEPLQMALARGIKFELAWRRGATLDWVANDATLEGKTRDWAIVVGAILKESKCPAILDFRSASHYPTNVPLATGEVLVEPPAIEGFIWRVKPVSGTLTRVYASTHDSHCFVSRPSKAFPPDRHLAVDASYLDEQSLASMRAPMSRQPSFGPRSDSRAASSASKPKRKTKEDAAALLRQHTMDTINQVASTPQECQAQVDAYRAFERRRQFDQISNADGYIDVKDIVMIRYLGDDGGTMKPGVDAPTRLPMPMPPPTDDDDIEAAQADAEAEAPRDPGEDEAFIDENPDTTWDIGGEDGLAQATDRLSLRRQRQFEVIMSNGRSTRFEAYSKSVAKEWVARLHDLAHYWKRREKIDALEMMEASGFDISLIRKTGPSNKANTAPGPTAARTLASLASAGEGKEGPSSTNLGNIWHWCAILGCRGIIRCGRLFSKKRAFAPFKSRYYILIAGRLLCYKLLTSTQTARNRQNAGIFHKRQETIVPLRDAYVYSGHLTEAMLSHTKSEGAGAMGRFASGGAADTGGRHKIPRVYADGLLSVDEDEDCTLVIRYRPVRVNPPTDPELVPKPRPRDEEEEDEEEEGNMFDEVVEAAGNRSSQPAETPSNAPAIPRLNDATFHTLVLRARSKLERDLWVRSLAYETERLTREDVQREKAMREQGEVPYRGH